MTNSLSGKKASPPKDMKILLRVSTLKLFLRFVELLWLIEGVVDPSMGLFPHLSDDDLAFIMQSRE